MESLVQLLPGGVISFLLFHFTSRDELSIKQKLPKIRFFRFEICPNIRFYYKDKVLHFHHWMNMLILLGISIPLHGAIADSTFSKSFLWGGILQGLLTPNSGKIIYRQNEEWLSVKTAYLRKELLHSPLRLLKKGKDLI
ncbi:hypothetical protein A2631_01525 [Candidatus Daviesbacteria bacterium RIFCSPHIGHO2_01_FULL_44_29]|uniref:Uncharacterized protein n=1 Tax=Candidatus Daviesbacteria bacterium RIFCSPHIGHO2_02_FULL_43_12 TaxID=1797776 RepID=A0A1F5KJH7_9BACT|nr:MAG: hypothetical protein A2631_01525 [Candidatus Daviesbacteria bacterium RIFCSPHIGHO2_01_FULL_44_29]OGE39068.1 MAG: hypothetical protein A3E86_00555 [Candidatus Daviesbacteria bacterium RIFCSPHIGHO2_12_FULL_47_45]OGE41087.1 MAG: hypothetical protein A3D25_00920 [Candidatus Daviesbacteria bacterium RIFCSPHIGHO2_02_FULL_43_12]OGE69286.1 MAG: hypothetical protein A3B55_02660 [Candidatus Daviesbacteria bacterium RIFCSPLOWO2_01_FULL_43_15]